MGDILEAKEMIEFNAVFGSYEREVLLVEGYPGSEKTTLQVT